MGILDDVLQQIDGSQQEPDNNQQQQPAPDPQPDPVQKDYDPNAKDANWYGDEFKRFAGIK